MAVIGIDVCANLGLSYADEVGACILDVAGVHIADENLLALDGDPFFRASIDLDVLDGEVAVLDVDDLAGLGGQLGGNDVLSLAVDDELGALHRVLVLIGVGSDLALGNVLGLVGDEHVDVSVRGERDRGGADGERAHEGGGDDRGYPLALLVDASCHTSSPSKGTDNRQLSRRVQVAAFYGVSDLQIFGLRLLGRADCGARGVSL